MSSKHSGGLAVMTLSDDSRWVGDGRVRGYKMWPMTAGGSEDAPRWGGRARRRPAAAGARGRPRPSQRPADTQPASRRRRGESGSSCTVILRTTARRAGGGDHATPAIPYHQGHYQGQRGWGVERASRRAEGGEAALTMSLLLSGLTMSSCTPHTTHTPSERRSVHARQ